MGWSRQRWWLLFETWEPRDATSRILFTHPAFRTITQPALRDLTRHAEWLRSVRQAAGASDYPLVINARVDCFLNPFVAGAEAESQRKLVPEALERASAYLEAGAECVYPIALWEPDALGRFMSDVRGPVNVTRVPQGPPSTELAALGVARVSWALYLYLASMAHFENQLRSIQE